MTGTYPANIISANLAGLREKINLSAISSHRAPASVKLIAVSKRHPSEVIEAAIDAGQTCFGENRVQEAETKFKELRQKHPELELHLIGQLQTNKAETAVNLFNVIQTLDRPNLAEAIAKAIRKTGKTPKLYIEVNIGNEPQKSGIAPESLEEFLSQCLSSYGLAISGLMCIPPQSEAPTPHFQRLKLLADRFGLTNISMGMSDDFESAIDSGATEVRIGTAIFGERKTY